MSQRPAQWLLICPARIPATRHSLRKRLYHTSAPIPVSLLLPTLRASDKALTLSERECNQKK